MGLIAICLGCLFVGFIIGAIVTIGVFTKEN